MKIADFGIAALLPGQRHTMGGVRQIEGSLPYMSPEQTGRTNRAPDQRSDLYALGITFHEMLAGRLPFAASDPVEWVHCHVARRPAPLPAAVPPVLGEIVQKLLAKEPEDRYQSARGLRRDLARCLEQWDAEGRLTPFPLGERDISSRFQIPQKLYGRVNEVSTLLEAGGRRSCRRGRPAGPAVPKKGVDFAFNGIGQAINTSPACPPVTDSCDP